MTDTSTAWKERFREPHILFAKLAGARPERGLVLSNQFSEANQLCTWNLSDNSLRQLTNHSGGLNAGWISPDGAFVYYLEDKLGSEMGHLVRLPFEGGPTVDISPDLKPYTLRGTGFSKDSRVMAFTAVNKDGFQLYVLSMGSDGTLSEPNLIHQSTKEAWGGLLSYDGSVTGIISTARAGGTRHYSLIALDSQSGEVIGELWDGLETSVELHAFSPLPGEARILGVSTRSGFRKPFVWDPRSDARDDLDVGNLDGEIMPAGWHPDGRRILLCQIHRAQQKLFYYDLNQRALKPIRHPSGTYYNPGLAIPGEDTKPSFNAAGDLVAWREDAAHPGRVDVIPIESDAPIHSLLSAGCKTTARPWQSFTFASSDGEEIQGWLGLPDGQGPFPLILHIHGGPHTIMPDQYNSTSQAWMDAGFAWCTLNYRGTVMFGQKYREQIWGNIGYYELEDIVAGRQWLMDQGYAQPNGVFLHGRSYGGFLTLWGLGKRPELWAGGIAEVAIADWCACYEDASEALKAAISGWHGGTPDTKEALYRERSPLTYAEDVLAPLYIIQGRSDSRTPRRQLELYEAKMKSLGKDIEVEWFDSGHFVMDTEENIGFQERKMAFAERVLKQAP